MLYEPLSMQTAYLLDHSNPKDILRKHPDVWVPLLHRRLRKMANDARLTVDLPKLFDYEPAVRRQTDNDRLNVALRDVVNINLG